MDKRYFLNKQDCVEWMGQQPEKSIDCVITSPPYNLNIKYGKYKDDLPRTSYLKWLGDVSSALHRVLKDDGHLFLNVGYSNVDPWVAMDVAQVFRQQWTLQNNITWVKHVLVGDKTHGIYKPITSNRFISPTNESVYHFTKTGSVPIDRIAIGHRNETHERWPELYSEGRHIAEHRRSAARKCGFRTWREFSEKATVHDQKKFNQIMEDLQRKKPWDPDQKKCIGNSWYVPYTPVSKLAKDMGCDNLGDGETGRGGHPATFPEMLPDMCIRLSGILKGSVVYDPFVGTGTTIVAAIKNGMVGFGTDLDEEYLKFAYKRIESMKIDSTLPFVRN